MTTEELLKLCHDRELVTPELHSSNDFYGHARVLKRYCGRPSLGSLRAAVEHSVFIQDYFWEIDLQTRLPVFLCAAPKHAEEYERRVPGKKAFAIGPMIRYVNPLAPVPDATEGGNYLLVFPSHSSHHIEAVFDVEAFADRALELGKSHPGGVKVCLYWKDVLRGTNEPFARRGLECVSAGHIYDFDFLPRLVRLLRGAAGVFSNNIGSHVLYATLLGIPAWIEEAGAPVSHKSSAALPSWGSDPNVVRMRQLFSRHHDRVTVEQRDFVDALTGAESYRGARELNQILDEADHLYRRAWTPERQARDLVRRALYLSSLLRR